MNRLFCQYRIVDCGPQGYQVDHRHFLFFWKKCDVYFDTFQSAERFINWKKAGVLPDKGKTPRYHYR